MIDKDIGFYNPPSQFVQLYSQEEVDTAIGGLAEEVEDYYLLTVSPGENLRSLDIFSDRTYPKSSVVALIVLKGGFMFGCQFLKQCKLCFETQFVVAKSYGENMISQQWVDVTFLDNSGDWAKDRDILILDDIADTFLTLESIKNQLYSKEAKSVKTCVLLNKPLGREIEASPDFYGIRMESRDFVIGCGLGMGEKFRTLPAIYGVKGQEEMDAAIKEYKENIEWCQKNLKIQ
jgi:hypoxanthine phosphoribosyltransferase